MGEWAIGSTRFEPIPSDPEVVRTQPLPGDSLEHGSVAVGATLPTALVRIHEDDPMV
jgi:hypothetical protein